MNYYFFYLSVFFSFTVQSDYKFIQTGQTFSEHLEKFDIKEKSEWYGLVLSQNKAELKKTKISVKEAICTSDKEGESSGVFNVTSDAGTHYLFQGKDLREGRLEGILRARASHQNIFPPLGEAIPTGVGDSKIYSVGEIHAEDKNTDTRNHNWKVRYKNKSYNLAPADRGHIYWTGDLNRDSFPDFIVIPPYDNQPVPILYMSVRKNGDFSIVRAAQAQGVGVEGDTCD